jgi:hypothetical protein
MPMKLLAVIASSHLPMSFSYSDDIDKLRILRAAGLVIAFVPGPGSPFTLSGPERAAQVLAITQRGQEELMRSRHPDEEVPLAAGHGGPTRFLRAVADRARQALR